MQMERVGQGKFETTACCLDGLKATDVPVAFSVSMARRDSRDKTRQSLFLPCLHRLRHAQHRLLVKMFPEDLHADGQLVF